MIDGEQEIVPAAERFYSRDFYGSPAWAFWLLCIAVGVIAGLVLGVGRAI